MTTIDELWEQIAAVEVELAALETTGEQRDLGHDLYRACMYGTCLSCLTRYVDDGGCAACKAIREVVHSPELQELYPWKSKQ